MEQNLIELKSTFESIEKTFNNPIDYINDECSELRRVIQLNKEEMIMNIKKSNGIHPDTDESEIELQLLSKIHKLNEECDQIMRLVNAYEKDAVQNIETTKQEFQKEFSEIRKIQLNIEPGVELRDKDTLSDYRFKFAIFLDKLKFSIFSNKKMELKKLDRTADGLNYHVYYKYQLDFDQTEVFSNKLKSLKNKSKFLGKDISSIVLDFFENEKYLMLITHDYYKQELVIIDPIRNSFKKRADFDEYLIHEFTIHDNLIYLTCSETASLGCGNFLYIINDDLEIVRTHHAIDSYIFVSHINPLRICEFSRDGQLRIFDSFMNLILDGTHQPNNELEPFYLRYAKQKFEYSKNKYYFFNDFDKTVKIFDTNGILINTIQAKFVGQFKVDLNGNVVLFNKLKGILQVYDENGLILKEIKLNFIKKESYIINEVQISIEPISNRYIINDAFRLYYYIVD